MSWIFRILFFVLIMRPLVLIIFGLNVRHEERLPKRGPAIIVANHNSHLDTMALIALFPVRLLFKLRPIAAADYFLKSRLMSWFSLNVIGIIPVKRTKREDGDDPLAGVHQALDNRDIVILYPEGTRGEPEQMVDFKKGVSFVAERNPNVPVVPIFLHGTGKALPKGAFIPVPLFLDVFVGEPMKWTGDRASFMSQLRERIHGLGAGSYFSEGY